MPEITQTQLYSRNKDLRAVMYGKETGLALTDSYADTLHVDNRHLSMTTIAIYNEGSNSLTYRIYGHLDDNSGAPPAFDGTWVELPKDSCETAVAAGASKGETFTENWAWLLVRIKRTTSGQDTTAQITLRSRQSRY